MRCFRWCKKSLIVLPDAHLEMAATNIAASMSGCAGQRCMAASAMVAVGGVQHIIDRLCEVSKTIITGDNLGSVISLAAKERIEKYITEAEQAGAKVLVDGRNAVVEGKEGGYYVGPTVIDYVTPDMAIAKEEVLDQYLPKSKEADEAFEIENVLNMEMLLLYYQSGGFAREGWIRLALV